MAPKSAEDFLRKAKKIRKSQTDDSLPTEEPSFVPGRDNHDADDFNRRELYRARTKSSPQFGTLSMLI